MGNLRALRQYRAEVFSTDALGFRNGGAAGRRPVAAIMAGDSFTVGSGVNDDETLAARLSERLGCVVYNAGGIDGEPDRLLALARRLSLARGLVVHEYQEDFDPPAVSSPARRRQQEALASQDPRVLDWVGRLRGFFAVSPLEIASQRVMKGLQNDRVLPNPFAANVARRTLVTGDAMLFLPASIRRFHERRPASPDYWVWLRDELQQGGLELAVVLVPSKYAVYRPFLLGEGPAPASAGAFLADLEEALRSRGIPVFNLSEALKAEAAAAIVKRQYLYLMDDIHWNAGGAERASALLAAWLRCPESPSGAPRVVAERLAGSGNP
jgi:hypothetical protein